MKRTLSHITCLLLSLSISVMGAGWKPALLDTRTGCNHERVKTLQVKQLTPIGPVPMSIPVINLGTDDQLEFSFDHLAEDREYLRYELVHCNANWQPSGLVDSEFLDGFNYGDITDYDFSEATTTHYVHYRLQLPNQNVAPLLSGNYLLKIYPENDPDEVWAQCRFMVSEQTARINADVTSITDIDHNDSHQQLAIEIDYERSRVADPFNDITVMVQQNGRFDNEVALRQPLRMSGRNVSVYEHQTPLIFDAGNEYRRFETVSVTSPGMHIEDIVYREPYYHFVLATDEPRSGQMYLYDQTQHGRFVVREYDSDESDTEADYGVVHFSLEMPKIPGAAVFIDGDLVDRRFDPEARMVYNHDTGRYERNMLLKQGAYNYQYLVVPSGGNRGYTSYIEGDNHQTSNEYLIKVYARNPGERYDRLIGVQQIILN